LSLVKGAVGSGAEAVNDSKRLPSHNYQYRLLKVNI